MSLQRNVLWSYVGQAYAALIGLVMVPVYVRYLGPEAYGLVGFFAMLQVWAQVLDLGLTPTLGRELSRVRAGALDRTLVAPVIRSLELFFTGVGVVVALAAFAAAGWVAREWFNAKELGAAELQESVAWMGVALGARSLVTLYRGALSGLERLAALNAATILFATVRSVGVVGVFLVWSTSPAAFFLFQAVAALLEVVVVGVLFRKGFDMTGAGWTPRWTAVRGLFRLAGTMAVLVALWTLINQSDRLLLSWTVSLDQYGFYMVAVTLAGGITLLAAPLLQALQPRFAILAAQGAEGEMTRLYRTTTQFATALGGALAGTMACFAVPLLHAWTGDAAVASAAGRVLPLYAVGNVAASLLGLAFLVQFAHGRLGWHLVGNCLFAAVWIPGAFLAARAHGTVGVGWVWLLGNLAYLIGWLPFVHREFLPPGTWWRWLLNDVLLIVAVEALLLALLVPLSPVAGGRIEAGVTLAVIAGALGVAGMVTGSESRRVLSGVVRRLLAAVRPQREDRSET